MSISGMLILNVCSWVYIWSNTPKYTDSHRPIEHSWHFLFPTASFQFSQDILPPPCRVVWPWFLIVWVRCSSFSTASHFHINLFQIHGAEKYRATENWAMWWKILNLKTNSILISEDELASLWIESVQLPKSKHQIFFYTNGFSFCRIWLSI